MLLDAHMLPSFVRDMREMKELLKAEQVELDQMMKVIAKQEAQLCINTADEKLSRYEQMFLLNPIGLTMAERRKNVIAKLNARIAATKENLIDEIEQMTGHPVTLKEFFDQYCFTVDLIQEDLSDAFVIAVREYLDMIKPAHLGYDLSLIRYEKSEIRIGGNYLMSDIMSWEVDLNVI